MIVGNILIKSHPSLVSYSASHLGFLNFQKNTTNFAAFWDNGVIGSANVARMCCEHKVLANF